jgi:hypothetical protein
MKIYQCSKTYSSWVNAAILFVYRKACAAADMVCWRFDEFSFHVKMDAVITYYERYPRKHDLPDAQKLSEIAREL